MSIVDQVAGDDAVDVGAVADEVLGEGVVGVRVGDHARGGEAQPDKTFGADFPGFGGICGKLLQVEPISPGGSGIKGVYRVGVPVESYGLGAGEAYPVIGVPGVGGLWGVRVVVGEGDPGLSIHGELHHHGVHEVLWVSSGSKYLEPVFKHHEIHAGPVEYPLRAPTECSAWVPREGVVQGEDVEGAHGGSSAPYSVDGVVVVAGTRAIGLGGLNGVCVGGGLLDHAGVAAAVPGDEVAVVALLGCAVVLGIVLGRMVQLAVAAGGNA